MKEIGDGAFQNCAALTNVVLPAGLTEIGSYLFRGCTELQAVTVPETVERIGRYAFSYCGKLGSVILPEKITEVGTEAFSYTGLWSITFLGDAPTVAADAFRGVQSQAFYAASAQGWNRKSAVSYGGTLTWEAI